MTGDSAATNRVHPEKDDPPHSPAYYAQVSAPPAHALHGPPQAPSIGKIEHARPGGPGSANGREAAFDPVIAQSQKNVEDAVKSSQSPGRRTWQMLAQVAVLVGVLNPHDRNVIDIYHAPKVGTSRFMIHPNSKLRRAWDIATALLVLYVITMVARECCFSCLLAPSRSLSVATSADTSACDVLRCRCSSALRTSTGEHLTR